MLRSTITPDGYIVNEAGERQKKATGWQTLNGKTYYYINGRKATGIRIIGGKRYYFHANGVQQTQTRWLSLSGNRKYYMENGVLQTGWQTIGGQSLLLWNRWENGSQYDGGWRENRRGWRGRETSDEYNKGKSSYFVRPRAGGCGAVGIYGSKTYYEYLLTREFASLIKQKLSAYPTINVTLYNQNYDLYQVMSGKKSGPVPKLTDYDYILEVHFNATGYSAKDSKGDGQYKGVGMYVNSAKKNTAIDQQIVKAISRTGFPIWGRGNGIFTSSGLFNAKICQGKGVSYGLLETAFIDDRDDITFYNKNKVKMAEAAASAIASYFNK